MSDNDSSTGFMRQFVVIVNACLLISWNSAPFLLEQGGCGKSGNSFNFSANLAKCVWTTVRLTKATVLYFKRANGNIPCAAGFNSRTSHETDCCGRMRDGEGVFAGKCRSRQ
jgi:hypothetical protein